MKDKDIIFMAALGLGAVYFVNKTISKTTQAVIEAPLIPFKQAGQTIGQVSGDAGHLLSEYAYNTGAGWNAQLSLLGEQVQNLSENLVKSVSQVPLNAPQSALNTANLISKGVSFITNPLGAVASSVGENIGRSLVTPPPLPTPPANNMEVFPQVVISAGVGSGSSSGSSIKYSSAGNTFYKDTGSQSVPIKTSAPVVQTTTKPVQAVTTSTFMGQTSYNTSDGRSFTSKTIAQQEQAKIK